MNAEVQAMIDKINQTVSDELMSLTQWESDFIQNVTAQNKRGFPLSDKQDEILEKIWKRAVEGL